MPKIKQYEKLNIPAFYRRSAIDLCMFAHVTALARAKKITMEDAIHDFMIAYNISYDEFSIESALTTYNRIYNNFIYSQVK